MTFVKAFILTILLLGLQFLISFVLEYSLGDWVFRTFRTEGYGVFYTLMEASSFLLAYLVIFKFIFRTNIFSFPISSKMRAVNNKYVLLLISLAIGLAMAERPFFDLFNSYYSEENFSVLEEQGLGINWQSIFYNGVLALVIAPIFEEVFFRRFVFLNLIKRYSVKYSIIFSSFLFALIHISDYRNLAPTFIFGIICCIIYLRTRNLMYCIILHFIGNVVYMILTNTNRQFYVWIYNTKFGLTYWVMVITGATLIFWAMKKIKRS